MTDGLRAMIGDVIADEFVLNRRLPRTVVALLFHPGVLTDEYIRGRMVRYIPSARSACRRSSVCPRAATS